MVTHHPNRLFEIDALRAFAIVLMVFTHVAIFFYDYSNDFLSSLADFGGWVCFTIFLFDSAAALPLSVEHHGAAAVRRGLWRRAIIFYLLYLLVGILYSLPLYDLPSQLWNIATLQTVPIFADFIFAFALFFVVAALLTYVVDSRRQMVTIWMVSILGLVGGYLLYFVPTLEWLLPLKSWLVGGNELHRFPLLQYFFVYASGVVFTKFHQQISDLRNNFALLWLVTIASLVAIHFTGFERWQASPGFILYGIWVIAILVTLGMRLSGIF